MASRTGARILVDQLLIQGVNHAFCVPGESYIAVLDALYDAREMIKLIVTRHESGATFMADAYAKLTGQPGVAFVTRGPGATNASIGIHTSFQDSTPVVLFIGQVGNEFAEREAFQEIDYRRMFGPMAKWVAQIDSAARVPEYIARAFQVATSGRPGPVVLALPEDMQPQVADVPDALCHQPVHAAPSDMQVAGLRRLLGRAQRPIVIAGGPGWTDAACDNLKRFVEANYLPVACAFRAQDVFDNRHPNYVGDVGIGINPKLALRIREADLVIAIGPRLGEMTTSGYTLLTAPVPTPDADPCACRRRRTRTRVSTEPGDQRRHAAVRVAAGDDGAGRGTAVAPLARKRARRIRSVAAKARRLHACASGARSLGSHPDPATRSAGGRNHHQRRRQFQRLGPSVLALSRAAHATRTDGRQHGLWRSCGDRGQARSPRALRGRLCRRRRLPDDRTGAGDRDAVRRRGTDPGVQQLDVRDDSHAPGTRVPGTRSRHATGQSGFRPLRSSRSAPSVRPSARPTSSARLSPRPCRSSARSACRR